MSVCRAVCARARAVCTCTDGTWSWLCPIPSLGSSQEAPAGPCARWVPQNSPVLSPVMAEELSELLREFDEVMEDFERGPGCQYQQHLEELKRKVGQSVYDSGIDELESESGAGA